MPLHGSAFACEFGSPAPFRTALARFADAVRSLGCRVSGGDVERIASPSPTYANSASTSVAESALTDEQLVADAVLRYVLTDKELESTREFYGTIGHKEIVLSDAGVAWPGGEFPSLAGYTVHRRWHEGLRGPDKVRMLGVRLDKFDIARKPTGTAASETAVVVSIQNSGGSKNGGVGGGCTVWLIPRKVDGRWVLEFRSAVAD
jgi:hypothetical protein